MISNKYIAELKQRNDITSVVQSYVKLNRSGHRYTGLCPFHIEKTPSFVVYPENQSFYCFGCRTGGDVITFIRRIKNADFAEAVKYLAKRAQMPLPEEYDSSNVSENSAET